MLSCLALCVVSASSCRSTPVLWLNPMGEVLVSGKGAGWTFFDRVGRIRTPLGAAYDFSDERSALLLQDLPELRLSGSMTVAAWIFARRYAVNPLGSQILFRGDDRQGLDPYYLRLQGDGKIHFSIGDATGATSEVSAAFPLYRWTRVTANLDAATGRMEMWVNGTREDIASTAVRPFTQLAAGYQNGVGVGNVYNEGSNNQPLDGELADVRIYSSALGPNEAGFSSSLLRRVKPLPQRLLD